MRVRVEVRKNDLQLLRKRKSLTLLPRGHCQRYKVNLTLSNLPTAMILLKIICKTVLSCAKRQRTNVDLEFTVISHSFGYGSLHPTFTRQFFPKIGLVFFTTNARKTGKNRFARQFVTRLLNKVEQRCDL